MSGRITKELSRTTHSSVRINSSGISVFFLVILRPISIAALNPIVYKYLGLRICLQISTKFQFRSI
jgi:hypothetical protein